MRGGRVDVHCAISLSNDTRSIDECVDVRVEVFEGENDEFDELSRRLPIVTDGKPCVRVDSFATGVVFAEQSPASSNSFTISV